MAESIGFEPMLPVKGGRLSKPLPSTTRPTLQNFANFLLYNYIITPLFNNVKYLAEVNRIERFTIPGNYSFQDCVRSQPQ